VRALTIPPFLRSNPIPILRGDNPNGPSLHSRLEQIAGQRPSSDRSPDKTGPAKPKGPGIGD
jgi:hypothetical protein